MTLLETLLQYFLIKLGEIISRDSLFRNYSRARLMALTTEAFAPVNCISFEPINICQIFKLFISEKAFRGLQAFFLFFLSIAKLYTLLLIATLG